MIDAHVHVWNPDRAAYPWLDESLSPLNRTITLGELETHSGTHLTDIVLIQAADNIEDTAVMREQATIDPRVVAIVAWAPLDDPTATAALAAEYAADPLVVGVRNLIHIRERGWLAGSAQGESLDLLASAGLTYDFVTESHDALAELPGLCERHPKLRVVIDHLGKPPIDGTLAERRAWRSMIAEAAEYPLVHAKLSGLNVATVGQSKAEAIRPFIDNALAIFGAERLMFGSDWPLVELADGRASMFDVISSVVDSSDHEQIFHRTARSFYATKEVDD